MRIVRRLPVVAEVLLRQTQFGQRMARLPEDLCAPQVVLPDHYEEVQRQNGQKAQSGPQHAGDEESSAGQQARPDGKPAKRTVVAFDKRRTQLKI